MSTSVYTGLDGFNFTRKHFLQICFRKVLACNDTAYKVQEIIQTQLCIIQYRLYYIIIFYLNDMFRPILGHHQVLICRRSAAMGWGARSWDHIVWLQLEYVCLSAIIQMHVEMQSMLSLGCWLLSLAGWVYSKAETCGLTLCRSNLNPYCIGRKAGVFQWAFK
jgi:hypothetical protein